MPCLFYELDDRACRLRKNQTKPPTPGSALRKRASLNSRAQHPLPLQVTRPRGHGVPVLVPGGLQELGRLRRSRNHPWGPAVPSPPLTVPWGLGG